MELLEKINVFLLFPTNLHIDLTNHNFIRTYTFTEIHCNLQQNNVRIFIQLENLNTYYIEIYIYQILPNFQI